MLPLLLMRLVAAQDGIIHGPGKIPQHGLFRGVAGDLQHDILVFAHFVPDGVGIVDQILVCEVVGDEEFVEAAYDQGEEFFLAVSGLGRAGAVSWVQREFSAILFESQVLLFVVEGPAGGDAGDRRRGRDTYL